jgi:hypothetical protein
MRVYIVTEGQTETQFVNRVLNPWFNSRNIILIPCTVVTKIDRKTGKQYKGGISSYTKVGNDIKKCLSHANKPNVYVTTMFDYYHFPHDVPGYTHGRIADPYGEVIRLEGLVKNDIQSVNPSPVFIPYLQLHEFETLMFCGLDIVANQHFDSDIDPLRKAIDKFKNPELINDSEITAPSKRLNDCISDFDKVTDGVLITEKIGIDNLRRHCRHFNDWITRLENLQWENTERDSNFPGFQQSKQDDPR